LKFVRNTQEDVLWKHNDQDLRSIEPSLNIILKDRDWQ
jgi:hypothetical protein